MRVLACLLSALLLVGCSDDPERPATTPERSPSAGDEGATRAAEVAAPEAEATAAAEATAPSLPDRFEALATLETRRHAASDEWGTDARYDRIVHPDPDVRRRLDALLEELAREVLRRGYGGCQVSLAQAHLVSVRCALRVEVRGGIELEGFAQHLAIEDGELRPLTEAELFTDGTDLGALTHERCVTRAAALDAAQGEYVSYPWGEDGCREERAVAALTPTGVSVVYHLPYSYPDQHETPERIEIELPYEELRAHIRAGGALGAALSGRDPRAPPPVAEDAAGAWAVTPFRTEPELIERWSSLPTDEASSLRLERWRGPLVRFVTLTRPPEALAAHFDATARPVAVTDSSALLPVRWARTTSDLNLRATPNTGQRSRGTLPAGAHVVAIGGELGARGAWSGTWTMFGHGWIAARYLAAPDACVPSRPDGFGPATLVSRVSVIGRNRRRDAAVYVRPEGTGTVIAIHALAADGCAPAEALFTTRLPGRARDVRLTTTARVGGTTMLVVGIPREHAATYRAFVLGQREPVWTYEATEASEEAIRLGESVGEQWFPVSYGEREGYGTVTRRMRWTGSALERVEPPAP
ncbi:MAG: hypothetical protein H6719_29510 [Sandaracinaceae bacterium]|nr:hypothetical protein [Sandaracinaceae bacterium]